MRFNNIEEVLNYIEQKTNFQLGLLRVEKFLEKANINYHALDYIHIGGTNGKGSTTYYLSNILIDSNFNVGMFSSPSIEAHNDRIRVNNNFILDEDIIDFVNKYYDLIEETEVTMFEIDVLMALDYFVKNDVDIVIMEVGMGGKFDGTNIIEPLISVITNIGLDHQTYLGNTKKEIALNKVGIIKENGIIITNEKEDDIIKIIENEAKEKNNKFIRVEKPEAKSLNPIIFDYKKYKDVQILSLANYQIDNISLVLEIILVLNDIFDFDIKEEAIRNSLKNIVWAGRFEVIKANPFIVLDGAHNVEGVKELVHTLEKFDNYHKTILFAALKDKHTDEMLKKLIDTKSKVVVSEFDYYRTKKASDIARNFDVAIKLDYKSFLSEYLKNVSEDDMIIITGSLYFISEVRKYLINDLKIKE